MPDGKKVINEFNTFYKDRFSQEITFLAAAGDAGTFNPDVNNHNYPFPTVGFPANSPWVTPWEVQVSTPIQMAIISQKKFGTKVLGVLLVGATANILWLLIISKSTCRSPFKLRLRDFVACPMLLLMLILRQVFLSTLVLCLSQAIIYLVVQVQAPPVGRHNR